MKKPRITQTAATRPFNGGGHQQIRRYGRKNSDLPRQSAGDSIIEASGQRGGKSFSRMRHFSFRHCA